MQLTMWQEHRAKWKDCTKCELHKTRHKIVLARGSLPCAILLVGEAPGMSEDSIGLPFQGPAGYILNQIIDRSIPSNLKYAITNLICCVPIDEEEGGKFGKPPEESIVACSDRLEDFIKVCDEKESLKLIITVGTDSRDWFDQKVRMTKIKPHITPHRKIPSVFIYHPSWILRKPLAQRSLEVQTAVVTIQNAIEEYITHPKKKGFVIREEDIPPQEDKPFNYEENIPF